MNMKDLEEVSRYLRANFGMSVDKTDPILIVAAICESSVRQPAAELADAAGKIEAQARALLDGLDGVSRQIAASNSQRAAEVARLATAEGLARQQLLRALEAAQQGVSRPQADARSRVVNYGWIATAACAGVLAGLLLAVLLK